MFLEQEPPSLIGRFIMAVNQLAAHERIDFHDALAKEPEGPERDRWLARNVPVIEAYLAGTLPAIEYVWTGPPDLDRFE